MGTLSEAKASLGQLFIIGIPGKSLSDDTASFLTQANIGGIIYFAHNFESPLQIAEFSSQIQACRRDAPLWISVDQEGGRVQRFKNGFTILPIAMNVANTHSPKLAFDISQVTSKELGLVGVNLNFTPVADILTNPKNPVIGDRAYGDNEDQVSKMITAVVRGHLLNGVQPCVKHFPGHGDTELDSHFALPKVEVDLSILRERELRPFSKAFKSKCNFVMTAHILNPKLDPEWPATLSRKTLIDILRNELRYSKIIVSDDLEMQAITDHFGPEDAPRLALQAGCDMLIYRTETAARKGYEALIKALESGQLAPEIILEAAQRVARVKKEIPKESLTTRKNEIETFVGCDDHKKIIESLEKFKN